MIKKDFSDRTKNSTESVGDNLSADSTTSTFFQDFYNVLKDMTTEKSISSFYKAIIVALMIGGVIFIVFKEDYTRYKLYGKTMGTTYMVRFWSADAINSKILQNDIDKKLAYINRQVSTWQKDSHISQFNISDSTKWTNVDTFFTKMISLSKFICKVTGGAFDITIAPLIDAWGFDAKGRVITAPKKKELNALMENIDCNYIDAKELENSIRKTKAKVAINLSAVAKGGAIDEIGVLLEEKGIRNYLIEIGGEVLAKGKKGDDALWSVGVETPLSQSGQISNRLYLIDNAIATSGDYRNYFEEDGIRYNHIISPLTGKPIKHKLASVSVLQDTAAKADAWATAFFVLGLEKSLKIAQEKDIAVFFILKSGNDFKIVQSERWKSYNKENIRFK